MERETFSRAYAQVRNAAVLVPDPTRAFAADHAGADRCVWDAGVAEQRAIGWRRNARHDVPADALPDERRRRAAPERRGVDRELTPCINGGPFVTQAQVAVRHVRDAAPAAADRPEDVPELPLRVRVAVAADAAREHVDDGALAAADHLDELDQRRKDVERLKSRDDDRKPVALDERFEDAPA